MIKREIRCVVFVSSTEKDCLLEESLQLFKSRTILKNFSGIKCVGAHLLLFPFSKKRSFPSHDCIFQYRDNFPRNYYHCNYKNIIEGVCFSGETCVSGVFARKEYK